MSEIVAEITSEPENLTAADVSASASIITNLTEGATKNPEVAMANEIIYVTELYVLILPHSIAEG